MGGIGSIVGSRAQSDQEAVIIIGRARADDASGGGSAQPPLLECRPLEPMSLRPPPQHLAPEPGSSRSHQLIQPGSIAGLAAAVDQTGPSIELRRHNRLSRSLVSSETLVHVRDGVLALEAVPAGGRRQILDFLMPGDAIPASVGVTSPGFFLRALTRAILDKRSPEMENATGQRSPDLAALMRKLWSHLMRRNLHQIMIGQLDTLSRVSSFLVMLALRSFRTLRANLLLPLPMSRDDIADYLAMNADTLSRIMMRMETLRVIRRVSRHSVKLVDDQRLRELSPICPLLLSTFGSASPGQPREPEVEPPAAAPLAPDMQALAPGGLPLVVGCGTAVSHVGPISRRYACTDRREGWTERGDGTTRS